ncbi:unnamed protein product [Heterobilharzia americana]|nr:unnamed protein product [Heterobilharzia americana]
MVFLMLSIILLCLILNKTLRHLRMRKAPEERIIADIVSFCCARSAKLAKNQDSDNEEMKSQPKTNPKSVERQALEWSLEEDEDEQQHIQDNLTAEVVQVNKTRGKVTSQKRQPTNTKKPVHKSQVLLDSENDFSVDSDNDEATTLADMVEDVSSDVEINSSPVNPPKIDIIQKQLVDADVGEVKVVVLIVLQLLAVQLEAEEIIAKLVQSQQDQLTVTKMIILILIFVENSLLIVILSDFFLSNEIYVLFRCKDYMYRPCVDKAKRFSIDLFFSFYEHSLLKEKR